jgi:ankyrin repeat protein
MEPTKEIQADLFKLFMKNKKKSFKSLVKAHPTLLETLYIGESYLYYAIKYQKREMIKLMLSLGANPMLGDKYGETPLAEALRNDDLKTIQMLVDAGVDVNNIKTTTRSTDEMEGLYISIHHDELEITKYLIEKGGIIKSFKEIIDNISSFEMVELLDENLHIFNQEGLDYWEEQRLLLLMKNNNEQ